VSCACCNHLNPGPLYGRYLIFCFDQLYIKFAVDATVVDSNWGRVFYTNLWACAIAGVGTVATEPHTLMSMHWGPMNLGALAISAALGVGMSYFAFLCRASVSATCFTIIGNVCKVLTVFINVLIWDKHATKEGLACLAVSLVAAAFYQQAPKRQDSSSGISYLPVAASS